jgi:rare lipoprotein A
MRNRAPDTQHKHPPGRRLAAALCALGCAWLVACSSAPHRSVLERDRSVRPAQPPATQSASSRGGYYKDDGPGENPPDLDRIADADPLVEPLSRPANNPYNVFGQDYVPMQSLAPFRQRGTASWYGRRFHGLHTSNGETYDMYAMSAAHPTLPIPSYARVTNLQTGRSVIVRVNDRGPFHSGRIVDLSYTAAYKLGFAAAGSAPVEIDLILPAEMPLLAARRSQAATVRAEAARAPEQNEDAIEAIVRRVAAEPPPAAIPLSAEAGGVYLQLGAFSARDNAESFRARVLLELGWLDATIAVAREDGMFRVHVGPYRNRSEALVAVERIRDSLELRPVFVVK